MARKPEILREAAGHVVKVVAPLLAQLLALHSYKVIYMDRPIEEVVQSQRRMIRNRGHQADGGDPEKMRPPWPRPSGPTCTAIGPRSPL